MNWKQRIKAGKGALQPIVGCPKERPCRMPTGHLWSIPNKGHVECLWCHRRKRVEANARPHAEARSADSVQADVGGSECPG